MRECERGCMFVRARVRKPACECFLGDSGWFESILVELRAEILDPAANDASAYDESLG